ncbi:hypothetical protein E5D57_005280 [Metarhizium anisopliae]|nr:hypothetical protein E5D57_005280 [Metarhizium anisopliae]
MEKMADTVWRIGSQKIRTFKLLNLGQNRLLAPALLAGIVDALIRQPLLTIQFIQPEALPEWTGYIIFSYSCTGRAYQPSS